MKRTVLRRLPDGSGAYVSPFHISMKGHEKLILFRDDEDYDAMVKILCVCAKRKNVIVIIYAVVSNHCHMAVLSKTQEDARKYGLEVKREDMHQCFCYMLLTGAAAGGVIYPPFLENEQIEDDCNDEQMLDVFCPDGPRSWRCFTFGSVDKCTDETFADRMRENENLLRQFVLDMKNQAKMNDSKRKASAQQSRNGTKA